MEPVTQEFLRARLNERLVKAGRPPLTFDGTEAPDLGSDDALGACLVLKQFDLATYVHLTLEYLAAMPGDVREAWQRSFTRTLFLAGNPAPLAKRFALSHVARDGTMAWTAPHRLDGRDALSRLLKRLTTGGNVALPARVSVPPEDTSVASGRTVRLCVATGGLRIEDYLIHLNHTLCESFFEGAVGPGDRLEIEHVSFIERYPSDARYFRTHRSLTQEDTLQLFAWLAS